MQYNADGEGIRRALATALSLAQAHDEGKREGNSQAIIMLRQATRPRQHVDAEGGLAGINTETIGLTYSVERWSSVRKLCGFGVVDGEPVVAGLDGFGVVETRDVADGEPAGA